MGDSLKISKDKRHRSSSSLSGVAVEGTRSVRKLDIRASIAENDDQFALAEARCDDLQEKIDLVKVLKRKRKLRKRSMTKLPEQIPLPENVPFISVRTQPKKKVSQQAARLRRLDVPQNPTRGYLNPTMVEQHHMLGQVRGYNQTYKQPQQRHQKTKPLSPTRDQKVFSRTHPRRSHADGDSAQSVQMSSDGAIEVACGDDNIAEYSDNDIFEQLPDEFTTENIKKPMEIRNQVKASLNRRRPGRINVQAKEIPLRSQPHDRSVVELFKSRGTPLLEARHKKSQPPAFVADKRNRRVRETERYEEQVTNPLQQAPSETKQIQEPQRRPRHVKYRSRRYEMPTVASQMKQAGMKYYYGNSNHTNIPFVVSKSTAPSHNIGVNIQQVLNGLKMQQPLSGIPLTIAHHMGLGHIETHGSKSATTGKTSQQWSLDNREINVIKLGQRLLRLPSYKYMSYSRLLSLYREGDGMVPRFLRAISRPHYFYTSMYNLATNCEDLDGATSKGCGGSHEAKQSLAEYASLYREYEHIDKCIKDGNYEPDLERRKEELARELAIREEHIRKVVQEYRTSTDVDQTNLRATASTAENNYRHSTFKLNLGNPQQ